MRSPCSPARARQRGVSLADALLALLVLSIGLVALSRLQLDLRDTAEAARERSIAVRLAQADIEGLRAFVNPAGWAAIDNAAVDATPTGSTTRYMLERRVQTLAEASHKSVTVTLHWTDRRGAPQQLQLATLIAGADPALSGALTLTRPPLRQP